MIEKLKHKYALSSKGAKDMVRAFIAVTLSNLVLMLPVGLLYLLASYLLDNQLLQEKFVFFLIAIVVILICIALTTVFQYRATFLSTYVESGVRRRTLAEKLRKLPLSYFGKKDLADLTNTIMSDCALLETASSHWIPELIGAMISTTIIVISLLFFDFRMALAAIWVMPIAFAIVLYSRKTMRHTHKKTNEYRIDCLDGIQEGLETLRDLRANNMCDQYMESLNKKIKAVEKHAIFAEFTNAAFVCSAQMILKLGMGTVAVVGSYLLVKGEITVLKFFMFLLVVARMYEPLQISLQNLSAMISLDTNCKRMDEILSHDEQTGNDTLTNEGYDIVFDHVAFAYNQKEQVLSDVSFTAKQGEVTALIGPSGGGKTTISRLAARFYDIDSGKIIVGGMDISKINPEKLLELYSIVFQDVTLFNDTIMENIRIGKKDATDQEVMAAAKLAHCDEFVENMPDQWNTMIGENGSELSGGQRQRISIARAFLKDAPIILMDEATASLDVDNESMIQESISKLIENKTVLIIAHRMRTVDGVDQIVVLKDGVVFEQGKPQDLKQQNGIYKHMVEMQMQSHNWKYE
ncbi:ABC transporter ATP-binding protein [Faecalibacillus intestinalis]|uniref:ABC transporter ATP-binding protein/permease n=1 Tax=Faecalibacillus intestinalis TaxID=1982626 RepID=A0AAW4VJJ9_9FIRM|nr:ABC transporter ATP-binding protein [Faecalibacillus intestinalis]MCB8561976.1 ABC transporter ATP-binding protein/permease [Faecalibacillus intestinalis]MCG4809386.1 ABC transporter ATP-binding protein/permease [Faecalibacillus intestinalis]MEE1447174.1 ABC transporter ATP-binding protein [Faecalibacillus intestinalis]RHO35797.1 ABC transporter ATP-binding protein [Coprobacillus sp. AM17-34]